MVGYKSTDYESQRGPIINRMVWKNHEAKLQPIATDLLDQERPLGAKRMSFAA